MERALARWAPLAASLLGHVAVLAVVGGLGSGAALGPEPSPIPVRRAGEPGGAASPRLALAAPGEVPGDPAAVDTVVSLDSADPRYRPYLQRVRKRIWTRWSAPDVAEARGSLVVEFTLARSGRVSASGVLEPSGTPALDRAALAAVALAEPFTPLPPSIAGDSLRVRARFTYD